MNLYKDLFYPGTFNPIHNGHLDVAEKARLETQSEKIVLIPAYSPYHKNGNGNATAQDKFEMTKLASESRENFEISDVEYRMKKEKSYTYETIKKLIEEHDKKPFDESIEQPKRVKVLLGADAFKGLASWYNASGLAKIVKFVVSTRPGEEPIEEIAKSLDLEGLKFQSVQAFFDISSTNIRDLVKQGKDISKVVPTSVVEYIKKNKLYI